MLSVLPCLYLPLPPHRRQGHQLNLAAAKASDAFDESLTGGFASEWVVEEVSRETNLLCLTCAGCPGWMGW